MSRRLIGAIVEYDNCLCLRTLCAWFPLGGNSGLASDFEVAFGPVQRGDIGKRVYYVNGVMQMENEEQRDARQAKEITS